MSQSVEAAVARIMAARYQPRVGDRVRVTGAIAECRTVWKDGDVGHDDPEAGAVGRVVPIPVHLRHHPSTKMHPVGVAFDPPGIVVRGVLFWGSAYAPTELELLEPAAAAADERARRVLT